VVDDVGCKQSLNLEKPHHLQMRAVGDFEQCKKGDEDGGDLLEKVVVGGVVFEA
jgi:hypothetical protein